MTKAIKVGSMKYDIYCRAIYVGTVVGIRKDGLIKGKDFLIEVNE